MSEINNPHDHFVKAILSQLDIAASFLTNYLPSDIVALLDTTNPKLVKGTFVDPELREHQSDLLFQVESKIGDSAYVYVLFEHKSYPGPVGCVAIAQIYGPNLGNGNKSRQSQKLAADYSICPLSRRSRLENQP